MKYNWQEQCNFLVEKMLNLSLGKINGFALPFCLQTCINKLHYKLEISMKR